MDTIPETEDLLNPDITPEAFIYKAKMLAAVSFFRSSDNDEKQQGSPDDFYVTWFAKTLQNWKAMVSTDLESGIYWEITYNGDKQESYVDFYQKVDNFAMSDAELIFDLEDDDEA